MFAGKLATYVIGSAGLALASPALADDFDSSRASTASSSAAGFQFRGSKGPSGTHAFFEQLRRRELERGRGGRGGRGQGHGYGQGHGNGHGYGHGHGHGQGHCADDDCCHASPG